MMLYSQFYLYPSYMFYAICLPGIAANVGIAFPFYIPPFIAVPMAHRRGCGLKSNVDTGKQPPPDRLILVNIFV